MKNIHILPTEKPTGIFESKNGLHFSIIEKIRYGEFKGFHIYITSDEEIKEGDFYLYCNQVTKGFRKNTIAEYPYPNYQKIILTTDQDLVKDGVKELSERWIEYIVDNPSCEFIEVKSRVFIPDGTIYDIIIPREETQCTCKLGEPYNNTCCKVHGSIPKQHVEFVNDNIEEFDKAIESFKETKHLLSTETNRKRLLEEISPEKETLERIKNALSMNNEHFAIRFLEQYADYKSQNLYSEEEVRLMLSESFKASQEGYDITSDDIIVQFKKK